MSMDRGASDSSGSRNQNESSLERKVKEVVLDQTPSDTLDGISQEVYSSEGKDRMVQPVQELLDAPESLRQDLPPSLCKGKSIAVDSDQESVKTIGQEEPLFRAKGKDKSDEYRIKFDLYNIPDQSAVECIVADLEDQPEHTGIKCDGPLCVESQAYIKGHRYKCTICDNIDFCSECAANFFNNHNATHSMVKCILPTKVVIIRKIDDKSKKVLLSGCGDATLTIDDIMHVVHAETESPVLILSTSESFYEASESAAFVILRSRADEGKPRIPRLIETNPIPNDDRFVTSYKIDEAANVIKTYQPYGSAPRAVRDEGVIHYQDPDLLSKVVTGQISQFRYPSDGKFLRDAWAGRMATRLIDLKPGRFDDKLECNVREVNITEGPVYEALSYTWKETAYERAHCTIWTDEVDKTFRSMSKCSHAIYCGDSFIQITSGLRDALRRLRDPVETKTYWIDQLSIDQGNLSERAFQVEGMRSIYNRAKRVIVWTGDEDEDTKLAFEIIRKLAMACNISRELILKPEELVADLALDLPSLESSDWRSILSFFERPVFERVWVIQEIVVAQDVVVRCGDDYVTWSELSLTAKLFGQGPWQKALLSHRVYQSRFNPSRFIMSLGKLSNNIIEQRNSQSRLIHIIMINGFREDFHCLTKLSVERLLYNTWIFEASDPRDKIYSILGIRGARIDLRATKDVQVDYKKSTQEVFTETTKAIILGGSSFNICGMKGNLSSKSITGLPSWVPDYSSSSTSLATSFSRPDPPSPYSASGDSEIVAVWPYENQRHILVASSYKADTIVMVAQETVLERGSLAPVISEWTSLASRGPCYVTGEFTPDVFWRTCVADTTLRWRQSPAPLSYHQSLAAFFLEHAMRDEGFLKDPEGSQLMNAVWATLAKDSIDAAAQHMDDANDANIAKGDPEAISVFMGTCMKRRFFVTAKNYFGIGPIDAQVGDEVHILSGAQVPFVFRKIKSDDISLPDEHDSEIQSYTMVGETYVHGLMKGEALNLDGFEWSGICVH